MVDVGYFINGKHGVIRNVTPISNTQTEHLCFMQTNGDEQYALKKENIEHIIPSDIDCISDKIIRDEVDEKPMTFFEKFKEVFGFEPNRNSAMCDVVYCDFRESCQGCPYNDCDWDWDKPYVKVEVEN